MYYPNRRNIPRRGRVSGSHCYSSFEIYRGEEGYRSHLATPHFRTYKEGTPHMIKSLRLVTMNPLDPAHMNTIFRKMDSGGIEEK